MRPSGVVDQMLASLRSALYFANRDFWDFGDFKFPIRRLVQTGISENDVHAL